MGVRAAKHPAIVKRIHNEGHIIGNHSYNHAVLSTLSLSDYRKQIWSTDAAIQKIIGYSPHFIRPPYGETLPQQVKWSQQAGFSIVNWDVDSVDWKKNPSSDSIIKNIKSTLQPGSIILQHAGGGYGQDLSGTIQALPRLIQLLRSKGYELVTLPELLGQSAAR
ncbi:Peptidoglycan-N-acetylglucosamine deacetylase [compost metagenome]